ncbi:hypothetical protein Acr_04g0004550 [Actinidia rufa]|uniref:Uncharacterized protein n=1 Tax=Actinidia rufa TaxID=165716 RepID=A0A7J0EJB9_9ERIC|nr:hypothetical protein Acr_04g0004550 [Actinidia rufa]
MLPGRVISNITDGDLQRSIETVDCVLYVIAKNGRESLCGASFGRLPIILALTRSRSNADLGHWQLFSLGRRASELLRSSEEIFVICLLLTGGRSTSGFEIAGCKDLGANRHQRPPLSGTISSDSTALKGLFPYNFTSRSVNVFFWWLCVRHEGGLFMRGIQVGRGCMGRGSDYTEYAVMCLRKVPQDSEDRIF